MFCTSCGAPNPEDAKFCNQCGARIAEAVGTAATSLGEAPARAPTGDAPRPFKIPTMEGNTTADRLELPTVGPSRRTLLVLGSALCLGGVLLGAAGAWSTRTPAAPAAAPTTPVDLIGEPAAVTHIDPSDAGPQAPVTPEVARAPTPAPTRARVQGAGTPLVATGPTAPRNTPAPQGTVLPAMPVLPEAQGAPAPTPTEPARPTETTPGTPSTTAPPSSPPPPTTPASPTAPTSPSAPTPSPGGEPPERGPRVSRAGFTEGDSTDATGTMDPQAFRFVYRHNAPQIAACYSSATRTRTVAGVITVRVRIAQSGQVARTRVLSDTTHDPDLARCVQGRIQTWRYPQPEGGEVEVDYPLRFGSP